MRRIMIIGGPGSGKSTLARALGQVLALPVHHLGHIHLGPGWARLPAEDRTAAVSQVLALPAYVFEGSFPETYAARLAGCDTLIWLDINPILRIWRLCSRIRRSRGGGRPDLPPLSAEDDPLHVRRFWRHFWGDLLQERATCAALAGRAPPGVRVLHLHSRREVRQFLSSLGGRAPQLVPDT